MKGLTGWWIVSLLTVIIKHHLAHKFKWPGKNLCNCRHWWTNLIQGPCKGFIWFPDCINQVFPEECLFIRFIHKQLLSLSRTGAYRTHSLDAWTLDAWMLWLCTILLATFGPRKFYSLLVTSVSFFLLFNNELCVCWTCCECLF